MDLSKDTHLRAQWFLQRFQPFEVLYHAILRPKLCSSELIEMLLKGGAVLSRNLMQLLWAVRHPSGNLRVKTKWASNLSSAAYDALHDKANARYDDWIPRSPKYFDDNVFEKNYLRFIFHGGQVSPKIARLMTHFKYMPLPVHVCAAGDLQFSCSLGYTQDVVRADQLLMSMPSLAPLMRANGERFFPCDQARSAADHEYFLHFRRLQRKL